MAVKYSGICKGSVWSLFILTVLCSTSSALKSQTVQLPVFKHTGVNTTVSVPDGGSTYLGGVNRASAGGTENRVPGLPFMPFKNRGYGHSSTAGGMSAHVQIHDFSEMEAAILGGASLLSPRSITPSRLVVDRTQLQRNQAPQISQARIPNVEVRPVHLGADMAANLKADLTLANMSDLAVTPGKIGPAVTSENSQQQERMRMFAKRGWAAEKAGDYDLARSYYELAAGRAQGKLLEQIHKRLNAIKGK